MDVNRTPMWLAADPTELAVVDHGVVWEHQAAGFALAPDQMPRLPGRAVAFASAARAESQPRVLDGYRQIGFLSDDGTALLCDIGGGAQPVLDGELSPVVAPAGVFVDLAPGAESLLALPWHDVLQNRSGLVAFDLRHRVVDRCDLPATPIRACVAPDRRFFVATEDKLLICAGASLPQPYLPLAARFEPSALVPHPLRVTDDQGKLPAGLRPLALAHDGERLFLLVADVDDVESLLARRLDAAPDAPFTRHRLPEEGFPFVVDLAPLQRGRLALLAPRRADDAAAKRDVAVVDVPDKDGEPPVLVRRRWPVRELADARFVASLDGVVRYPERRDAASGLVRPSDVRELVALPLPKRRTLGLVRLAEPFDSGLPGCVWHRLYLDACIPEGTSIVVRAAALDRRDRDQPADPAHPDRPPPPPEPFQFEAQPPLVWNGLGSELPFAQSVAPSERGRSGLFELLFQTETGSVRRLAGRWLWLEIGLVGDGRATPLLHAVRAFGPRFCWQERYLPEHFRQEDATAEAPESEEKRKARPSVEPNGADFRERWLANFEGLLTPIEGRVAAAELLLDPECTPEPALPWLASFLGREVDLSWPEARRRRAVAAAGELARRRGTLEGARLALDVATDGLVEKGAVVVVENFRLRRTLATILGVDLDDQGHPLTLGTMESGNSIVGDSLILSEETAREFLALYDPDALRADERLAVEQFLDRHAHKVTVLLHGPARDREPLVRRVLEQELPAHLQWELFATDRPFVLGLAPLLSVDTWVERTPPPRGVVLDDTFLTREGLLLGVAAFSPAEARSPPTRRPRGGRY